MAELDRTCPLCGNPMDKPISGVSADEFRKTIRKIRKQHPEWKEDDGACTKCLVQYGMMKAGRAGDNT